MDKQHPNPTFDSGQHPSHQNINRQGSPNRQYQHETIFIHGQQSPQNYPSQQQYGYPRNQYPLGPPPPYTLPQQPYHQQQGYYVYTEQSSPSQGYSQQGQRTGKRSSLGSWTNEFDETSIRRKFVRKVYAILTLQLLLVSTITVMFLYVPPIAKFSSENRWLVYVAMLLKFIFLIVLMCCKGVCRVSPYNYIILLLFTVADGCVFGVITAFYKIEHVALAAGICTILCFCLTLFAMQTKWDVTGCGMFLFAAIVILMIFAIIMIFIRTKTLMLIYSSLAALLFSFYIIYDTQLIMGDRKYAISPEEYIFAVLMLYIDVTQLFLALLSLIGGSDD